MSGQKTHENLMAAFAGESQANRKYLAYAKKAESEGIRVSAVSSYCHNREYSKMYNGIEHKFIINYAGIETQKAVEALNKLLLIIFDS